MGGYGSTRWLTHWKKTQVEECRKLGIKDLKPYLDTRYIQRLNWYRGERKTASISFHVHGDENPSAISLIYTITKSNGEKVDCNYRLELDTTPLPWGGLRYWFQCPIKGCGQRVGCLYLPPGGIYFGCRHCYDLTYQSSQEGYQNRRVFSNLAAMMQGNYPGMNWKDARAMLDGDTTPNLQEILFEKYIGEWENYDPYEHYLTPRKLCEQSGLSENDIQVLKEARLLLPDRPDGRYRPKLAGWCKKLAYLLAEGWEIDGGQTSRLGHH